MRLRYAVLACAAVPALALPALVRPARAGTPTVPLSNVFTSLPGIANAVQTPASAFSNQVGGHAGLLTFELPDDYDAVQIGVVNQFKASWGISRIVVAPSANYGGDPLIGAAPYDRDGKPLREMLPVQWLNNGSDSAPPGNPVVALATRVDAPAGQTTLTFPHTASAPVYGSKRIAVGWFVADGVGCIPAGATVTALTGTTVTLSAPVKAPGCGLDQDIYFAPQAFGPFAHHVLPGSGAGDVSVLFSDWVPVHSLPRTDGGFIVGARVGGAAIAPGTTISAVGANILSLSLPLTAALPAQSPLDVSYDRAAAIDAPAGSSSLQVTDASGVRAGQSVGGNPGLAAKTRVSGVVGNVVSLDAPTTGLVANGAIITFGNRVWTSLPGSAGDLNVGVPSTNALPLLHVRYFTAPGPLVSATRPGCTRDGAFDVEPCEAPLGLPAVWSWQGGETKSGKPIDAINFIGGLGAGRGTATDGQAYPSFFIRFLGRHMGGTLLQCGGYQASGATGSVSGEAAVGRIGAALATRANPAVPIAAANIASPQNTPPVNLANCTRLIDTIKPTMVMIQDYSDKRGLSVTAYRAKVQAVAEHALSMGAQPIIYLAYIEAAAQAGDVVAAGPVVNGTVVPLLHGISSTVAGSPTLIDGPGIQPGTTAVQTPGTWYLTLSRPATISAGSVLFLRHQVAASAGTSVTLTQPSFLTVANERVAGQGIPHGTTISVTAGSTAASLSAPATIPPGTVLTLAPNRLATSVLHYTQSEQYYLTATAPWASTWVDALAAINTDPQHPGLICPGCSTQGAYVNDLGNLIIANRLLPVLQKVTGQTGP